MRLKKTTKTRKRDVLYFVLISWLPIYAVIYWAPRLNHGMGI